MALRDHSLDEKIHKSAFNEFMEKGYEEASLRTIAQKADVTIGAIRTRFKTKSDLFLDCISPLIIGIKNAFSSVSNVYNSNVIDIDKNHILEMLEKSMRYESNVILSLLFQHYDEAVLLLCKSHGSSYEGFFDSIIDMKVKMTMQFFSQIKDINLDDKLLKMFISLQFHSYYEIIASGMDMKTAKQNMDYLIAYHTAGWCAVFNDNLSMEV